MILVREVRDWIPFTYGSPPTLPLQGESPVADQRRHLGAAQFRFIEVVKDHAKDFLDHFIACVSEAEIAAMQPILMCLLRLVNRLLVLNTMLPTDIRHIVGVISQDRFGAFRNLNSGFKRGLVHMKLSEMAKLQVALILENLSDRTLMWFVKRVVWAGDDVLRRAEQTQSEVIERLMSQGSRSVVAEETRVQTLLEQSGVVRMPVEQQVELLVDDPAFAAAMSNIVSFEALSKLRDLDGAQLHALELGSDAWFRVMLGVTHHFVTDTMLAWTDAREPIKCPKLRRLAFRLLHRHQNNILFLYVELCAHAAVPEAMGWQRVGVEGGMRCQPDAPSTPRTLLLTLCFTAGAGRLWSRFAVRPGEVLGVPQIPQVARAARDGSGPRHPPCPLHLPRRLCAPGPPLCRN